MCDMKDENILTVSRDLIPGFLKGMARLMDFRGVLTNYDILIEDNTDENVMRRDWAMVGYDLQAAIEDYQNG